jgi:hypothetical protein
MNTINYKGITNVQGLIAYIGNNSTWSTATIRNVITALGFHSNGGLESLMGLSTYLADCAKHGADSGFPGFTYYYDTLPFFCHNRQDIVKNLELMAEELGVDLIGMVQRFCVFRCERYPTVAEVNKALWDVAILKEDLASLYNAFTWFALDEISRVWFRYLEDNPRPIVSREPVSGYCP